MYNVKTRKNNREKRKVRIRGRIVGSATKPRLSVYRSNKFIYAQLIDDSVGNTIVDVFAEAKKLHEGIDKTKAAFEVGKVFAKKALSKKIETIVFDRNGYNYHGRVKSFAEGAREGGLKF